MTKKCLGCDATIEKPPYKTVKEFEKRKFHSQACSVAYNKKHRLGFWSKNIVNLKSDY